MNTPPFSSIIFVGLFVLSLFIFQCRQKQAPSPEKEEFSIIAYYNSNDTIIDRYDVSKLTHIIYSFCHLKGNRLTVDNAEDSITIRKLVSLKTKHPDLKILLSLGGWGGCKSCSEVFSTDEGRQAFAESVKTLFQEYNADGLDLDWEYPSIPGFPGHPYTLKDKANFTALIQTLRARVGDAYELSFAAGGFNTFLHKSVDWQAIMPLLDRVNIMTYDLTHGFSVVTGHHTPLYSSEKMIESTDNCIRYLDSIGIPSQKLVIGAAFYARIWENVENINHGLFQPGKFKTSVAYNKMEAYFEANNGYQHFWDSLSQAPYSYHPENKWFASYDNERSIELKTQYALDKNLGGIMFWVLPLDKPTGDLVDIMDRIKKEAVSKK